MSFILYKDVIRELSIKFNYEAIVHILANPYASKLGEMIENANPFNNSIKKNSNKHKRLTAKDLVACGLDVPDG